MALNVGDIRLLVEAENRERTHDPRVGALRARDDLQRDIQAIGQIDQVLYLAAHDLRTPDRPSEGVFVEDHDDMAGVLAFEDRLAGEPRRDELLDFFGAPSCLQLLVGVLPRLE